MAIIFIDLDNTIVKDVAIPKALSQAYEQLSKITKTSPQTIKQEVINLHMSLIKKHDIRAFDWDFIIETISHKHKCEHNIRIENLIKKYVNNAEILDNALDILAKLKTKHALILATNGHYKYQKYIIKKFKLQDYFNMIITSDKVGCLKSSKKFYKTPENNNLKIMIGDNPIFDVYYPKQFGLKTILIDRGVTPFVKIQINALNIKNIKPDYIIKNFNETLHIINTLENTQQ
jgi:putative hydrolase of the HAD superfamily